MSKTIFSLGLLLLFFGLSVKGQTTPFTFQGQLNDTSAPANGIYDFRFTLYQDDKVPVLTPIERNSVQVANGVFTVELDFGAAVFDGTPFTIQIEVRRMGEPDFTLLTPRQHIRSTPYALKSLLSTIAENSEYLGGVHAQDYVLDDDPRLTDERSPTSGSIHYIHNSLNDTQANANFNISGSGSASVLNASSHFSIGGIRTLAAPAATQNLFAGAFTAQNTTGNYNSFFGFSAGRFTTLGGGNAFFGTDAGRSNTIGSTNSFFGRSAGLSSTVGNRNSFFGVSSGFNTAGGSSNTFVGAVAGFSNETGSLNTLLGAEADLGGPDLTYATAIGAGATVSLSNSIVLGRETGADSVLIPGPMAARSVDALENYSIRGRPLAQVGGLEGTDNTSLIVGDSTGAATVGPHTSIFGFREGASSPAGIKNSLFGSNAGLQTTTGGLNSFFGHSAGWGNTTGGGNTFIGHVSGLSNAGGSYNSFLGHFSGVQQENGTRVTLLGSFTEAADNLDFATAIGAHATVDTSNTIVLGRYNGQDKVVIPGLGTGGDVQLCSNAQYQISYCSSSERYKSDIARYSRGRDLLFKLQPISFAWSGSGLSDLGLAAEEVAQIEPLLVSYSRDGAVEGVKYDRLGVILINALREQQAEIDTLNRRLEEQGARITELERALKALLPNSTPVTEGNELW